MADTGKAGAWARDPETDERQLERAYERQDLYDEKKSTEKSEGEKKSEGEEKKDDELKPFPFINVRAWQGTVAPPREWLVTDRIPIKNVTGLYGDGGTGKSLLLLQLAVSTVLGRNWLGAKVPVRGPALVMACEDDADELHRRLEAIARYYKTSYRELAEHGLHLSTFAGRDALLSLYESRSDGESRSSAMEWTDLFRSLSMAVANIRPRLIGLDNAADVFGGNEIVRLQVRQFITQLHGLALRSGSAVVLNAHPSQSGLNTGSGTSGSTGWNNAFRSRMYLKRVKDKDDEEEPDHNLRELEVMKANYAPIGHKLQLRYQSGVFVPTEEDIDISVDVRINNRKVDERFLALLDRNHKAGRFVSCKARASANYAPVIFAAAPPERGVPRYSKRDFEKAMERLFASEKIRVDSYGKPSNPHERLVRN